MNYFKQYHPEVLRKLQAALDGDRRALYPDLKKYIGTSYDFIGLSVPTQRKVFKAGYSFSGEARAGAIWNDIWLQSSWYEAMTQAMMYVNRNLETLGPEAVWEMTRPWSVRIDNWAHSDELSGIYARLLEQMPKVVFPQLQAWNRSERPWERRLSVVGLIEYSKKREAVLPATKLLGMVKPLLGDDHYFVQKGVGWTLREIGNVYPEQALRFLEKHARELSATAFTIAVEKVDVATKETLKMLRKRV